MRGAQMLEALRRVRRRPVRALRRPAQVPLTLFEAGYLTRRRGADPGELVFAAVDLETTGLDPRSDRVCEIGVIRFRADGTVLTEFASVLDPQRPMDATEFHGLDEAHVRGAPTFAEVLPQIGPLLADAVVVAHNLAFEDAFLAAEIRRAGRDLSPRPPGLCTLVTARAQLEGPGYGLATLYRSLTDAPLVDAHTALGDARATAELLTALLAQAPSPLRYAGPRPGPEARGPAVPPRGRTAARPVGPGRGTPPAEDDPRPRHSWRRKELAPAWGRCDPVG
ncbi:DNA polymerase III epsilon subunit-like protein [Streptacidiphilus sp. MAP12-20]|uniref:3'-5' exonuclease n=1 Tax=Streptacidiphilus sp. MAP12-20 TaxID=3156299 RepID=UPI003518B9D6